jgi:hypothetical protein
MAQSTEGDSVKYRKFSVYAGGGPSIFFNNVQLFKNSVNPWGYAISARVMWEPEHSKVSLGIETGYNRQYSANTTLIDSLNNKSLNVHVTNSAIPILFIVSMKFSKQIYANWSMGQSFNFSNVNSPGYNENRNSKTTSLADFSATVGYRFIQKTRINYAAELKGYYSSSYSNATIAVLFIVGFKL